MIICEICLKEYRVPNYRIKSTRFCSKKCRGIWQSQMMKERNPFKNPLTRQKLSKAKKGIPNFKIRGNKNGSKQLSARLKISRTNKGKKRPDVSIYRKTLTGSKSPFWKGGITPLSILIRSLKEMDTWRINIFQRDNYTCKECYKKGELEAHHLKPFKEILQEFLNTYNQFSPIEDKETLVRLAITYEPFWNIDNGITLCKKCHKLTRVKKEYQTN